MITLNVFGDFAPINRGIKSVSNNTAISADIKDVINNADYNIVNLECPVVYSQNVEAIQKDGPNLRCSEETIKYLKDVGFDLCTLANNHFKDYGEKGIDDTFITCKKNSLEWVGAGRNLQEARSPKVIEIKGVQIGILNICEHESSIATDVEAGSNPIDVINNYYDINNLKHQVDILILIIHGGVEHYNLPSPRMKKLCHFYADIGVSAIICHHTHCFSGYEIYNDVPIFYSLGNFFFDRIKNSTDTWGTGYFVQLQMEKKSIDFQMYPYFQCVEEPVVKLMTVNEQTVFKKSIVELNAIINDDILLAKHYQKWMEKRCRYYISTILTWSGKWFKALFRRGYIHSFVSKQNALLLLNYIRCESHRDLLIRSMKKYIDNKSEL
ncbi:MAG: CapA family protein [Prevotella sp.]|nr:CapA family protein [Prevotella sp.]